MTLDTRKVCGGIEGASICNGCGERAIDGFVTVVDTYIGSCNTIGMVRLLEDPALLQLAEEATPEITLRVKPSDEN